MFLFCLLKAIGGVIAKVIFCIAVQQFESNFVHLRNTFLEYLQSSTAVAHLTHIKIDIKAFFLSNVDERGLKTNIVLINFIKVFSLFFVRIVPRNDRFSSSLQLVQQIDNTNVDFVKVNQSIKG